MKKNPRLEAARRQSERLSRIDRGDPEDAAQRGPGAASNGDLLRSAMVEGAIQIAIRRGDFNDLPGAGKPLPGLDRPYDPDWWIRRKIETEHLHGLGPAALTLRVEDSKLNDRIDQIARESEVREILEDFNRRVIEARRQLESGPPVITPTRDIETEIAAWRERRANRPTPVHDEPAPESRTRRRGWRLFRRS